MRRVQNDSEPTINCAAGLGKRFEALAEKYRKETQIRCDTVDAASYRVDYSFSMSLSTSVQMFSKFEYQDVHRTAVYST